MSNEELNLTNNPGVVGEPHTGLGDVCDSSAGGESPAPISRSERLAALKMIAEQAQKVEMLCHQTTREAAILNMEILDNNLDSFVYSSLANLDTGLQRSQKSLIELRDKLNQLFQFIQ